MSDDFDTYFRTAFDEQLKLVGEPGMWAEGWSWDRRAAWLLYNATEGNDMAGTRRTTKKTPNEIATQVQGALKFLSVGHAASGDEQATHTWFQEGWGMSFNGIIAAACPIPGLDLSAFPDTALLADALAHVGKEMTITVEETGVHIASGDYDAIVPVGDRTKMIPTMPDAAVADLPPGFTSALERCSRIISDTAQTVRDAAVWLRPVTGQNYSTSMVSTNGKAVIECNLGGYMPPGLLLPKAFNNALLKCGKTPTKWGFSPVSFTVWFEDGSYIRTNTYDPKDYPTEVGDRVEQLMEAPTLAPPPKGFFEAVEAVAPFGDGSVYFLGGYVRSGPNEETEGWACEAKVATLPDGVATNAKTVLLFRDDAKSIYFGNNDDKFHRVVIMGDQYRAAIGGMRSVELKSPAPAAEPPRQEAPAWGQPVAEVAPEAAANPPPPAWAAPSTVSAAQDTTQSSAPAGTPESGLQTFVPGPPVLTSVSPSEAPPAFTFTAQAPDNWGSSDDNSDDLLGS